MFKPTVDAAVDAASILFNLPEYRVIGVTRTIEGVRQVLIDTPALEAGCPSCGVVTSRVHQRTLQRVRDVPFDGLVTVWWVKKRWRCAEPACGRATFTEHTEQVPPYARLTMRLKERIVAALAGEVRCVDAVAAELGVSWPTAMRQLTAAMAAQAARARARPALVHSLGIDEHRFRTVRWYRDEHDTWRRVEPWMTTFTNLATGQVIGVVDGRDSAAVRTWLKAQPRWWRHRVRVVAIDPSAAFRSAVRTLLPKARVSVDHFHLVKLANDMVTQVRRRVSWDTPRPPRPGQRPDLGQPAAADARLRHPVPARPGQAEDRARDRRPDQRDRRRLGREGAAPPAPGRHHRRRLPNANAPPSTATSPWPRCPRPPA